MYATFGFRRSNGVYHEGGRVVVKGTPEMVANCDESITAGFLVKVLEETYQEETA